MRFVCGCQSAGVNPTKKLRRHVKFADDATGEHRTQSRPAADADWGSPGENEE